VGPRICRKTRLIPADKEQQTPSGPSVAAKLVTAGAVQKAFVEQSPYLLVLGSVAGGQRSGARDHEGPRGISTGRVKISWLSLSSSFPDFEPVELSLQPSLAWLACISGC